MALRAGPKRHVREGIWLAPLLAAACFSGEGTRGLPCSSDQSCDPDYPCVQGICGGPQAEAGLRGASVLFVVDTASDSAALQDRLARSGGPLLDRLRLLPHYRVGFVSADLGGPACEGPGEGGALVAESCRDRASAFGEAFGQACAASCPEGLVGDADALAPTAIPGRPGSAPRPWLEGGTAAPSNLRGAAPAELFACLAPQGTRGCTFGQPIAAARRAIERALDPEDPSHGFLRQSELLVLVFVTAGVECSHPPSSAAAFDPEGAKSFWGDTEASAPTPALCWNAGVACSNAQAGLYHECHAEDRALDGAPADAPERAALTPVAGEVEFLRATIAEQLGGEVMVAAFTGVHLDFAGDPGLLQYPVPNDMDRATYGIGPGCTSGGLRALPPVRVRDLALGFDAGLAFASACNPDWSAGMTALGVEISRRLGLGD